MNTFYKHPVTGHDFVTWLQEKYLPDHPPKHKPMEDVECMDVIYIAGKWQIYVNGKKTSGLPNQHGSRLTNIRHFYMPSQTIVAGNYHDLMSEFRKL